MANNLGPQCTVYGITSLALLSYASPISYVQVLPEAEQVTNEIVLELVKFKDMHSQCTYRTLYDWIKALYGTKWPLEEAPTPQTITKSIERLGARFSKVKKQHNGSMKDVTISEFLEQEYVLPRLGYFKGRVLQFSPVRKPASLKDNHKPPGQCKDEYV